MTSEETGTTRGRDYRLDTLRALSIVLVLLWHLQPFRFSALTEGRISAIPQELVSVFNWQLTLIAVPTFYVISLYLFYSHQPTITLSYLGYRLRRLAKLYVFWTAIQFTVYLVGGLLGYYFLNTTGAFLPISPAEVIINGGPPPPLGWQFSVLFPI